MTFAASLSMLIQMICPTCGFAMPARIVAGTIRLVRCPKCTTESPLPSHLRFDEATEDTKRPEWQLDPSMLRHDKALIKRYSSGTVIAYSWMGKGALRIIILLCLLMLLPFPLLIFGPNWEARGFGILSMVLIYFGFSAVFNSAWVRLTGTELIIHYAPLPGLGAGIFHRSTISGVRIEAMHGEGESHCVYIDRHHQRSISLSPAFGTQQMAQEIKDTIDEWLKPQKDAKPLGAAPESQPAP